MRVRATCQAKKKGLDVVTILLVGAGAMGLGGLLLLLSSFGDSGDDGGAAAGAGGGLYDTVSSGDNALRDTGVR